MSLIDPKDLKDLKVNNLQIITKSQDPFLLFLLDVIASPDFVMTWQGQLFLFSVPI